VGGEITAGIGGGGNRVCCARFSDVDLRRGGERPLGKLKRGTGKGGAGIEEKKLSEEKARKGNLEETRERFEAQEKSSQRKEPGGSKNVKAGY